MGLLDDAIREHLELKRRRGADPTEIERAEREALGPVRRSPEPPDPAAYDSREDLGEEPAYDYEEELEPPYEEEYHGPSLYGGLAPDVEPLPRRGGPAEYEPIQPENHWDEEPLPPAGRFAHGPGFDEELLPPGRGYGGEPVPYEDEPFDERGAVGHFDEPVEPGAGAYGEPVPGALSDPSTARTPPPHPAQGAPPAAGDLGQDTAEYRLPPEEQEPKEGDEILEETPEFLQDTPDHDRLWFEQRPPRDFDFDG